MRHGRGATADALACAFEPWDDLRHVTNLPGYLFRVGLTRGRKRRQRVLFAVPYSAERSFEPALPAAFAGLTQRQRLAVVLVHGYPPAGGAPETAINRVVDGQAYDYGRG